MTVAVHKLRSWLMSPLACLTLAACLSPSNSPMNAATTAQESASGPAACSARVMLSFSEPLAAEPDDSFVTDLARGARAHLVFLRTVGAGIHLFELTAEDSDPTCGDALERLRKDSRVRSADLDVARKHQ
jgi:hypothetical protein